MKNCNAPSKRIRWELVTVMIAATFCSIALTSCNTVEGVGEDVQRAGGAIESTARDVAN